MEGNKEVNNEANKPHEHHECNEFHEHHDNHTNQQSNQHVSEQNNYQNNHQNNNVVIEKKRGFLNRSGVYGLELAVALITMIITVSVLSFAAFSLGGYLANADVSESAGYFALWTVASSVVWAPVALIFYLRSRAEMLANPSLHDNSVQKTFITIYQVIMILTIISFSVSTVFAGLMSLVKPEDTTNILLSAALPSAISAILFALGHVAFYRRGLRRRNFTLILSTLTILLVVPVVALSIMSLRSIASDKVAEADMSAIKNAVDDYAKGSLKTPDGISDIQSSLPTKVQDRLDNYEYKRIDGTRYQLCANFVASSGYNNSGNYSTADVYGDYSSYVSFTDHGKGKECFKLKIESTGVIYDDYSATNDRNND